MTLALGSRLGPYGIIGAIGAGGMGEVFRARDTKLNRDVAIKVLPGAFADDPERLARFTREAQTLASLNHPNIAAIYGIEEIASSAASDDLAAMTKGTSPGGLVAMTKGVGIGASRALVMELVEGEDLSAHIARGPIPMAEALPIARQIAEALEAAHEQGIVHRDLKPANIKVRSDGTVKVLDFGLAKAMDGGGATNSALSQSPTMSRHMTEAGMIIGTAAYMSPEQAKGKTVDKRTDIWAFGVVLYEMLTGTRLFAAEDVSETLAAVLTREVNVASLPPGTPSRLKALVRDCLVRDSRQRLRDIGDARLVLDRVIAGAPDDAGPSTAAQGPALRPPAWQRALPWMLAGAAALVAAGLAVPALRHLRETPPPETRLEIFTPAATEAFALSPDGRQIVFVALGDPKRLWLRSLATTTAQPLAGTEGARFPFWSPDGRSIGFFAAGALKRLDLAGGAPQTLAPAPNGSGGTWNADGVILFAPNLTSPLMRVSATGGASTAATTLGLRQTSHLVPSFLPDGQRVLFTVGGASDTTGIYLGALDGSAPTRLTPSLSQGVYLPPGFGDAFRGDGWLLWVQAGTLVAQRLDLDRKALVGEPLRLADGVTSSSGAFAAAAGLLAYRTDTGTQRQLTWVDRSGTARGTVGDPDGSDLAHPRVSPDGRRVIVERVVQGNKDLWLLDGPRMSRLTFDPARDERGLFSPDGTRIVFRSDRTNSTDFYLKPTNGAGVEELVVASDRSKSPTSWTRDGRFLLFMSVDPKTGGDLWVAPMVGDHTPSVFLKTPFREAYGEFSPDGRWVAYQSDESGRMEIYLRPFVPPGAAGAPSGASSGDLQVSTTGGIYATWRPDGKELYYLNPGGAMMAAPITIVGATLEPGTPVVLFPTRIVAGGEDAQLGRQYDLAPDGRFLINTVLESAPVPITLVMNWNGAVKK